MKKQFSWSIGLLIVLSVSVIALTFFKSSYGVTPPVVSTGEAEIEETSGLLKASIENNQNIDQCGFKWGTSPELSEDKAIYINKNNISTYDSISTTLKNLEPGVTYYYQAFAVNLKGWGYGDIKSFTIPVKDNNPTTIAMVDTAPNLTPDKGQAMEKTSPKKEPAVKKAASQNNTQKANSYQPPVNTNVSRGSVTTNTSKYPKLSKVNGAFGQFRYRELGGGRIEVDPQWVAENIVTITLPGLNKKVQVHKAAADNFIKAFNLIKNGTATINGKQVPLLSLIKTMDGTFVTRHVNWNPEKGLSNHSWGTAIDINASNHFRYVNPAQEANDPNLILWEKAFKPAGFSWGNSYSDSMHYEIIR